jgi:hypothetical protein
MPTDVQEGMDRASLLASFQSRAMRQEIGVP